MIWCPPVGAISGKVMFKKRHLGPARFQQRITLMDFQTCSFRIDVAARHGQRLKQQKLSQFLTHNIEPQQWIAQMIEQSHEQHEVEHFPRAGKIVNLHLFELNSILQSEPPCSPLSLREIERLAVDAGNVSAARSKFEAVKPRVTADIPYFPTVERGGQVVSNCIPLQKRTIAEQIVSRGLAFCRLGRAFE